MEGLEGLPLLPIDPTKTGESEVTGHLRETLNEVWLAIFLAPRSLYEPEISSTLERQLL